MRAFSLKPWRTCRSRPTVASSCVLGATKTAPPKETLVVDWRSPCATPLTWGSPPVRGDRPRGRADVSDRGEGRKIGRGAGWGRGENSGGGGTFKKKKKDISR